MNGKVLFTALIGLFVSAHAAIAQPEESNDQHAQACRLHVTAGLDMQTLPDGRVTVPVTFEGHAHRLMVDTGGYINTVTQQLVREEDYATQTSHATPLQGIGTRTLKTYVEARDFGIGNAHGKDFVFYVDVFNSLLADGTLAPEILTNYDVDFDFGHDRLNLIQPEHCAGSVVYWTRRPAAIVPMEIEGRTHIRIPVAIAGKEIMATLDTGSTTSIVTMRAAQQIFGINEKSAGLLSLGMVTINGVTGPVFIYPLQGLTVGGIAISHPYVEIVPDSVWNKDDLLIGIDVLRQLHLYIAYGEKKLYVTPALDD